MELAILFVQFRVNSWTGFLSAKTNYADDYAVSTGSVSDRVSSHTAVEIARTETRSLPVPVLTPIIAFDTRSPRTRRV